MNHNFEKLKQLIDKVDDLTSHANLSFPAKLEYEQVEELNNIVSELKDVFVKIRGKNPWE